MQHWGYQIPGIHKTSSLSLTVHYAPVVCCISRQFVAVVSTGAVWLAGQGVGCELRAEVARHPHPHIPLHATACRSFSHVAATVAATAAVAAVVAAAATVAGAAQQQQQAHVDKSRGSCGLVQRTVLLDSLACCVPGGDSCYCCCSCSVMFSISQLSKVCPHAQLVC